MRRVVRVLAIASVVAGVTLIVVAWRQSRLGDGAGRPSLATPMRPLRGFVARRFNPLVVRYGLVGGRRSPWALIEHVGRRSGTTYRTPILPRRVPDGFEIPLPYGADAQWVQNVRAAGHARLQVHETICELDSPEIVVAAETLSLTRYERWRGEKLGYRYLRVRSVDERPGTFAGTAGAGPMSRPEATTPGQAG